MGLNFNAGATVVHISNIMMNKVDRQQARERNQREQIMAITKQLSSGKLHTEGRHYYMDTDVCAHNERNENDEDAKIIKKRKKHAYSI